MKDLKTVKVEYLRALVAGDKETAERLRIEIIDNTVHYVAIGHDGPFLSNKEAFNIGIPGSFLKNLPDETDQRA